MESIYRLPIGHRRQKLTSPKRRYDPDILGIRQPHAPDPKIATGTNGGPRDDILITAL
jgi:hypothetical protein